MTDNEKIAEFMGLPLTKQEPEFSGDRNLRTVPFQKWQYHTSWDWLMPVCYKWDSLPLEQFTNNEKKRYIELCDILDHYVSCYEIQPVYDQLVKNISWYNNTSQTLKK